VVGATVLTKSVAAAVPVPMGPWSNALGVAAPLSLEKLREADTVLQAYKWGLVESFDRELFDGTWIETQGVRLTWLEPEQLELFDEEDIEMRLRRL
jgi:hypothetical protein